MGEVKKRVWSGRVTPGKTGGVNLDIRHGEEMGEVWGKEWDKNGQKKLIVHRERLYVI